MQNTIKITYKDESFEADKDAINKIFFNMNDYIINFYERELYLKFKNIYEYGLEHEVFEYEDSTFNLRNFYTSKPLFSYITKDENRYGNLIVRPMGEIVKERVPEAFKADSLIIRNMNIIGFGLYCRFESLCIENCIGLTELPKIKGLKHLTLKNCKNLTKINNSKLLSFNAVLLYMSSFKFKSIETILIQSNRKVVNLEVESDLKELSILNSSIDLQDKIKTDKLCLINCICEQPKVFNLICKDFVKLTNCKNIIDIKLQNGKDTTIVFNNLLDLERLVVSSTPQNFSCIRCPKLTTNAFSVKDELLITNYNGFIMSDEELKVCKRMILNDINFFFETFSINFKDYDLELLSLTDIKNIKEINSINSEIIELSSIKSLKRMENVVCDKLIITNCNKLKKFKNVKANKIEVNGCKHIDQFNIKKIFLKQKNNAPDCF